ncbi:hypothetical protein HY338_02865, partial [Candidatus Gottesmanbacteria bacterium]|nr:hypothetical protein [Candidatus Gottesmanbacteria bacterium]
MRFALYILLTNIILLVINIPLAIMYLKAPTGTFFPLIHQTHIDYYLYLSAIRESLQGAWMIPALFTSEPTQTSLLYVFFIFLGKVAYIFHLTPISVYHLARVISIEFILIGIYLINSKYLEKKWVFWGSLAGLLSTVPPNWLLQKLNIVSPLWWNGLNVAGRLYLLPHHAFGIACLLFSVNYLLIYLESKSQKYVLFAGFLSFLSAISFPPAGLVLVLGIPISIGLYLLRNIRALPKKPANNIISLVLITLLAVLGLLILRQETLKGFPWSQWKDWDLQEWNKNPPIFNRDYFIGSGLLFIISIMSSVKLWIKERSLKWIFLSVWAFLPYFLLPFTDLIGIGRIRVTFMANYVPMGIIGVLLVKHLVEKNKNRISKIIISFGIIIMLALLWGPVTYRNIKEKYDSITFGYINIHIP